MSKRVKKGKNAQRKKNQRKQNASVRSSNISVAQQRAIYEEEEPRAELGAGVRARAKGTTMPLGVRILVGLMAFTMLTMMGVVSYSSLNDFDIIDWLTGEDVAPGTTSETNSASAMTAKQRIAVDATNKFDGFFVVDEDSGITLTDVNSDLQTADTAAVTKKYKEEADEKREEILKADKEKIDKLNEKKTARDEAKENNPFKKFSDGLGEFRDAVVALFTNTWDGLTGKNRADEIEESVDATTDLDATGTEEIGTDDLETVDSEAAVDYNVDGEVDATESEAKDEGEDDADSEGDEAEAKSEKKDDSKSGKEDEGKSEKKADESETKSLNETLADANGLGTSSSSDGKSLTQTLSEASGI